MVYLLIPVALFTSWLAAVIGMGGGIVLLSVMTFFLSWQVLIPIHGLVQLTSNSSRTFFLLRHIDKQLFFPFLLGAPLGGFIGYFFIKELNNPNIPLLMIVGIIVYTLFKPKKLPSLKIPKKLFFVLGFFSGFLGLLVGATGPFLAPFFLRDDLHKENIIATKAICQTVTHIIKIPIFMSLGFPYWEHWLLILSLCLAAIVGTRLGVQTLSKINEGVFRVLYRIALSSAALRILWKVFL